MGMLGDVPTLGISPIWKTVSCQSYVLFSSHTAVMSSELHQQCTSTAG